MLRQEDVGEENKTDLLCPLGGMASALVKPVLTPFRLRDTLYQFSKLPTYTADFSSLDRTDNAYLNPRRRANCFSGRLTIKSSPSAPHLLSLVTSVEDGVGSEFVVIDHVKSEVKGIPFKSAMRGALSPPLRVIV
jgi:hypothetical protein